MNYHNALTSSFHLFKLIHVTKSNQIGISNVILKFVSTSVIFSEWLVNQHRDSAASYIGHYNLLDYFALVENETRARTKFNLLEVTKQLFLECFCSGGRGLPCGKG